MDAQTAQLLRERTEPRIGLARLDLLELKTASGTSVTVIFFAQRGGDGCHDRAPDTSGADGVRRRTRTRRRARRPRFRIDGPNRKVASEAGATVIHRDVVMPHIPTVPGKGEAMWRAVAKQRVISSCSVTRTCVPSQRRTSSASLVH